MSIYYSKPQLQLLLDLINESNPGLLEMRDLVNSRLGVPFARTPGPGEIQDTSIELYALPGSFYIGKRIVHYRRIQLNKLFANVIFDIDEWAAGNLPKADWIRLINERYGLKLDVTDVLAGYGAAASGDLYTISVDASSVGYAGNFRLRWTRGKRTLDQIIPLTTMTGLYWDANYVQGKPLMNLVGMPIDFSRFSGATGIATGAVISAASSDIRAMAEWFSAYTGKTIDPRIDHTQVGGIGGLTITRFTLPSANLPEANAAKFNRALVITPQAGSWFCGKIIWHYNA
ncbi:hypothetical protein D3C87_598340 [compost metagenome]